MEFCKNLKRIRAEKGYATAKDFITKGLKNKIKYTTYAAYETNRLPPEKNIIIIASALKVSIDDLFGYDINFIKNKTAIEKALDILKALPIVTKRDTENKEVKILINSKEIASIPETEIVDIVDVYQDWYTKNYLKNMQRRLFLDGILKALIAYGATGKPAFQRMKVVGGVLKSKSDNNADTQGTSTKRRQREKVKKIKDYYTRLEMK